ncbi:MAG: GNAT family N-acetyltransferase, partial [Chloroflexota bacterium]
STPKQFPLTLAGFVWRENSSLIGNLNLVPIRGSGERAYLIANVAVHPDHRRKGIARALTDAAISYLTEKQVTWCWLQVDDDNQPAINLYEQSGFSEQARTTTWQCDPPTAKLALSTNSENIVNSPTVQDWEKQQAWLNQTYPQNMAWHIPLNYDLLKPGLQGAINRLISDKQINQWAARGPEKLLGVLSRQSSSSQADKLWLAASPENDDAAIELLIPHARRSHPRKRTLALEFPSNRAVVALTKAGFYNHQTLIWMRRSL